MWHPLSHLRVSLGSAQTPALSITNLITHRQLSGGEQLSLWVKPRSHGAEQKQTSKGEKKETLTPDGAKSTRSKETRWTTWVNIRRLAAEKLTPTPKRKIWDNLQGETVYVFQKRQLLLHKCCLRSNHRPASWRHLKSEPDTPPPSPFTALHTHTPVAREQRDAHSSIGNFFFFKKNKIKARWGGKGGRRKKKVGALHWLLLWRDDSSLDLVAQRNSI